MRRAALASLGTILACLAVVLSVPGANSTGDQLDLLGLPAIPWLTEIGDDEGSARRIALGAKLFSDTRLSGDGRRSCATCHIVDRTMTEPLPIALGANGHALQRNTPTLINVAFMTRVMWDGKFSSLEAQALEPFTNAEEMGTDLKSVLGVVTSDPSYKKEFAEAFGHGPDASSVADALAEYQRSLIAGNSAFDRYLYLDDKNALSAPEKRGYSIFLRANCILCHEFFHWSVHPLGGRDALFTDVAFHNLGVGYEGGKMKDVGRYRVTGSPADWGRFRTPTLRNIALTSPYMHDGSQEALEDVVKFYNKGGNPNPNLDPGIRPLGLTENEQADLVSFLKALTSAALLEGRSNGR